jgi:hypothetical protein
MLGEYRHWIGETEYPKNQGDKKTTKALIEYALVVFDENILIFCADWK